MTMASDTISHDYDRIPVIMPYKAIVFLLGLSSLNREGRISH